MDLNNIKKYVINLAHRKDRLEQINDEFKFMGWDFERFDAINTGGYRGCAESHMKIAELAKEQGLDMVMACEDDTFFMPYAKDMIQECMRSLESVDWSFFHLGPCPHRPLNNYNDCLVDLSNPPPKGPEHRGTYTTTCFIYKASLYDEVLKWNQNVPGWENAHEQKPVDVFFDEYIYPNFPSFTSRLPIVTQTNSHSDINHTFDSNHYKVTYNWNSYINPIPGQYFSLQHCQEEKYRDE